MTGSGDLTLASSAAARLLRGGLAQDALTRLTDLAARLLSRSGPPLVVQVSLMTDVQTVAAASGVPRQAVGATSRLEDSLCTVTVSGPGPLVVPDARREPRVAGLPPVVAGAVGTYAGVPLVDRQGSAFGAVCAFGPQPRSWPDDDVELLELVAGAVLAQLEAQASSRSEAREDATRLLDTMATGFADLDHDARVLYLNDEGSRVVGRPAGEVVGQVLWDVFPGLEDSVFGEAHRRAVAERCVVEVEDHHPCLGAWFEVRVVPTPHGASLYFLDVTGRHLDQERARAATARIELLSTVSGELAAAGLDVEGAVARLARLTVPVLADWCLVSLSAGGTQVRDVGHWHSDPVLHEVADRYVARRMVGRADPGAVQQARDTARPVVVPSGVTEWVLPMLGDDEARRAWLELGIESIVVVPLVARGTMTGVLTLCRHATRAPMTDDEITTATEIAARAALALDNARLYAQQRSLAEGLQRSLLTTPQAPDHCEIVVRYAPAAEAAAVGGDWFDSFRQQDGATLLVIGDVTGHDTAAAAAMGQLRGLLRGIAWQGGGGPAEILSGLDAAVQGLEVDTSATALVARLEQTDDGGRLRWSSAGHPPPMLVGPDGRVSVLSGTAPDLLLGFDPATSRGEADVALPHGATVLLYTDGLVERRGQDLDEGLALLERTLEELAGLPLPALCDALLARLLPPDADDDVALLAVRLRD